MTLTSSVTPELSRLLIPNSLQPNVGSGRFVLCLETCVALTGFEVEKVLRNTVILGLDPRIHKETGRVPVVRWIAGPHPQGDVKGNDPCDGRRSVGGNVLQRPRCSGGMCDKVCALKNRLPDQVRQ